MFSLFDVRPWKGGVRLSPCSPSPRSVPAGRQWLRTTMRSNRLLPLLSSARIVVTRSARAYYPLLTYKRTPTLFALTSRRALTATSLSSAALYSTSAMSSFYELKAERPDGLTYDFEQLKGKVVLIVNVASKWYVICAVHSVPLRSRNVQRFYATIQGPRGALREVQGPGLRDPRLPVQPGM